MPTPESSRPLPWRSLLGLLLAGLLGWLVAWISLPGQPDATPDGTTPSAGAAPRATTPPPLAGAAERPSPAPAPLEQLLQKQRQISAEASQGSPRGAPQGAAPQASAVPAAPGRHAAGTDLESARAARRQAMLELQSKALAEIRAVPPGDTRKLMEVVTRFDGQMRAAGAPSIIDLDKLRQNLEGAERIQRLNRQLMAEAERGRDADAAKVKALAAEIQAVQKSLPQQFIRTDVLQRSSAP